MTLRTPSVAGTFYPGRAETLRAELASLLPRADRTSALAVVVPHAAYRYSGRVAGAVYSRVAVPRDVVLLCFNHRGFGAEVGVWPGGAWRTPLGDVPVDGELSGRIRTAFPGAAYDEEGHREEHSGEVQVPFLQAARSDVRIVPVALSMGLSDFDRLRAFGRALATVTGEFLVVASTDLNHYEDQATTLRKDATAIAAMERLDAEGLREALTKDGVSMCGFAPTIAAIEYARARGATKAETVMHATSGDVTGEADRVVGYVGMIIRN